MGSVWPSFAGRPRTPAPDFLGFSDLHPGAEGIVLPVTLRLGFFWGSMICPKIHEKPQVKVTTVPFTIVGHYFTLLKSPLATLPSVPESRIPQGYEINVVRVC